MGKRVEFFEQKCLKSEWALDLEGVGSDGVDGPPQALDGSVVEGGVGAMDTLADIAAAVVDMAARVLRPAPQKGLTKEQRRLVTRLNELRAAADWRGIAALETEALALARDVRRVDPGLASWIHSKRVPRRKTEPA
jgi:hypothetical protein